MGNGFFKPKDIEISYDEFFKAIKNDKLKIVKKYLDQCQDYPDVINQTGPEEKAPLHVAVEYKCYSVAAFLMDNPACNANIKYYGMGIKRWCHAGVTPLMLAAKGGDTRMMSILLSNQKTEVNAECEEGTALHFGVQSGDIKIIKLLVDSGISIHIKEDDELSDCYCDKPSVKGRTASEVARQHGYGDIVGYLNSQPAEQNEEKSIARLMR